MSEVVAPLHPWGLAKRNDRQRPNALAGGQVEEGEDPVSALRREVEKEPGCTVDRPYSSTRTQASTLASSERRQTVSSYSRSTSLRLKRRSCDSSRQPTISAQASW